MKLSLFKSVITSNETLLPPIMDTLALIILEKKPTIYNIINYESPFNFYVAIVYEIGIVLN